MNSDYLELIKSYKPADEEDRAVKKSLLQFIQRNQEDILTRENAMAHLTASTVIVNETFDKMLMIHHKIYDTWTWQGGHCDGEADLLKVALKEAEEETGIRGFQVLEDAQGVIVRLDILPVRAHMKNGEPVPVHLHLNAAFLLQAREDEKLDLNEEETNAIRWVPFEEIDRLAEEPDITPIYHALIRRGLEAGISGLV
jgi:8-oxo-dGTP pyrophosphatase MutT (NUDIX family)